MDSFELNKIIGAILGTLLFVMGIGFLAEAIYHPIEGNGPGYPLPEPEGTVVAEAEVEEPAVPLGVLLASASAERGAAAARKCQSCHNFEQGAGSKIGPDLYGVVGRVIGSAEDFDYSDGMAAHHDAGDEWTYAALDAFLTSPDAYVPGTKMNFGGIDDPEERANILAYLGSLSESPVPFPAPDVAPAAEAAPEDAAEEVAPEGIEAVPEDEGTVTVETEADAVESSTQGPAETGVEGTAVTETDTDPLRAPELD